MMKENLCKVCFHDHSHPDLDDLEAGCDCDCRDNGIDDDYDVEMGY